MPLKDKEKLRAYKKQYNKKHYEANRKRYIENHSIKRKAKFEWFRQYKKTLSCEYCGFNKCVGALHFHHKDPKQKDFRLSKLGEHSMKKILEEISKCIVLCANCHAIEHERIKEER